MFGLCGNFAQLGSITESHATPQSVCGEFIDERLDKLVKVSDKQPLQICGVFKSSAVWQAATGIETGVSAVTDIQGLDRAPTTNSVVVVKCN